MIDMADMMSVIQKHRGNAVVVPAHRAAVAWPAFSDNQDRDISSAAMSKGSSLGLGVSLAQPGTKVIVIDGDGSMRMNLGSMVTIANKGPKNLYHFVIENGMYATTGGQPTPGKDVVSLRDMARAAGYAAAYEFDDLEDFATQIEKVLSETGPVFVCVRTIPNPRGQSQRNQEGGQRHRRRNGAQAMQDLRKEFGAE
jgi:thiamine pyrophosphate-dependent acetolactate synthase large subunit-like protein